MFEQLKSLEGKSVRHFSHNDLDGYAPQILSRLSKLDIMLFAQCGYDSFEEKLEETISFYENHYRIHGMSSDSLSDFALLITDIAPKSKELVDRMNKLFELGLTIVLLDHHDTSKWIAEQYPEWAWINSQSYNRLTCGTELLHLYLNEKNLYMGFVKGAPYLNAFVELVRSYDTWDWDKTGNVKAKDLNSLLYILGPSRFLTNQIAKISKEEDDPYSVDYTFDGTEELLIEIENKKESKYIESRAKTLRESEWNVGRGTYKVGVVYGDQYHSTLGNELHKRFPELHFIAIIDMNSGKASLRTTHDHVHVGEIAKAIAGGGGHQKAAGLQFNRDASSDVVQLALLSLTAA